MITMQPLRWPRRGFLKTLLGIPALVGIVGKLHASPSELELPVGCDLSMTALHEALNIGERAKFGRARRLLIGPENLFPAREILGLPAHRYTSNNEINWLTSHNLIYQLTSRYPKNTWAVQFEYGVVKSVGPGVPRGDGWSLKP